MQITKKCVLARDFNLLNLFVLNQKFLNIFYKWLFTVKNIMELVKGNRVSVTEQMHDV